MKGELVSRTIQFTMGCSMEYVQVDAKKFCGKMPLTSPKTLALSNPTEIKFRSNGDSNVFSGFLIKLKGKESGESGALSRLHLKLHSFPVE